MEQFDCDELSDQELDHLLGEWKAPLAPARLRSSVFPHAPERWWKQFWSKSIRVPLPVAIAIALVLVFAVWRWPVTLGSHTVPATQSPGAPDKIPANRRPPSAQDREQLRPVMELKPVIIGRTE
jgi:hypothetical protein